MKQIKSKIFIEILYNCKFIHCNKLFCAYFNRLTDQIRQFVEADVNRRREYLKTLAMTSKCLYKLI